MGEAMSASAIVAEKVEFWFVWTKKGRVPRRMHDSFASADTEARRLAAANPGTKFIVLQAVSKVSVAP